MLKMRILFLAVGALLVAPSTGAEAAILGPDAAICAAGKGPAVLVKVMGLKSRSGKVRARTFLGSAPSTWFDKKQKLLRTEVDIPSSGPVEICMPVPRAGGYVVDIRHDINQNSDTDRADGIGASGDPKMSLFAVLFGQKPPASQVVFQVGEGVTTIAVNVRYASGSALGGGL
jgi:uncharacterized protein (DUF2141 family)